MGDQRAGVREIGSASVAFRGMVKGGVSQRRGPATKM